MARETIMAAEAAYIAGDDARAVRLAQDAAHMARSAGDIDTAADAAAIVRVVRDSQRAMAMAGWGAR